MKGSDYARRDGDWGFYRMILLVAPLTLVRRQVNQALLQDVIKEAHGVQCDGKCDPCTPISLNYVWQGKYSVFTTMRLSIMASFSCKTARKKNSFITSQLPSCLAKLVFDVVCNPCEGLPPAIPK